MTQYARMQRNNKIVSGQIFGRWKTINEVKRMTQCICECGATKIIASKTLWSGASKSCGCFNKEVIINRNKKEINGIFSTNHDLYSIWKGIKKRCTNKNCKAYKNYGGRGISICDRWSKSFANFVKDMGDRPAGYSIERINNEKGYYPENCKWAGRLEQAANQRSCRYIACNGQIKTCSEWSRNLNGNKSLVYNRIRLGWEHKKAVTTPVMYKTYENYTTN
jgi:hypothetical protein